MESQYLVVWQRWTKTGGCGGKDAGFVLIIFFTLLQLLKYPVLHSYLKQELQLLTKSAEIHTCCICQCCWGLPAGCQSPVWCSAGTEASATLCHLSQHQPVQMCAHTYTDTHTVSHPGSWETKMMRLCLTKQIQHLVQLFPEPVRVCENSTCRWAKSNIHCPLKWKKKAILLGISFT